MSPGNPLAYRFVCILLGLTCLGAISIPPAWSQESEASEIPLEQKIGQMILVGFSGNRIADHHPIVASIRDHHLGGVLLAQHNIENRRGIASREDVKRLTSDLQAVSPVPLLIAVDYEGGRVSRFRPENGFPITKSARALGRNSSHRETAAQAESMAGLLSDLGINLNLAPVIDLAVNPSNPIIVRNGRSFSADPLTVTAHARAFIRAHRAKNIFCAVKHFPGHGSSSDDTHLGRTDITGTWSPDELVPYRLLIREGLPDFVMTAHVFHRRIDDVPATLSRTALTTILRGQLGFEGVILSDDLHMGAIAREFGLEAAVIRAVHAGVDMLVFTHNPKAGKNIVPRLIDILMNAVDDGRLPPERIDASHRRIMTLKERLKTRTPEEEPG